MNTNLSVLELQLLPWYNIKKLAECIHFLRKVDFSVVEQRKQALERLNSIPIECPFSYDVRFPLKEVYILETFGDWARKFQQLKSALSYKDRLSEIKPTEKDASLGMPQNLQDSQQAFWNSTTSMFDQLVRRDGAFDRSKFENYFNLTWFSDPKDPLKGTYLSAQEVDKIAIVPPVDFTELVKQLQHFEGMLLDIDKKVNLSRERHASDMQKLDLNIKSQSAQLESLQKDVQHLKSKSED